MREIKFRVWDSSEKEMVDWAGALYDPDDWLFDIFVQYQDHFLHGKEEPEDILMQYTGLKDKNGIKIYEGDIVKSDWSNIHFPLEELENYIIFYDVEMYRFSGNLINAKEKTIIDLDDDTFLKEYIEVVGNIYENPELIKDNTNEK